MLELDSTIAIAIVVGLSQLFKQLNFPVKFVPLLNIILGILIQYFYLTNDVRQAILGGVVIGLSASGLYSSAKNISQGVNNKK
jgi:hypothetical protein